MVNNSAYVNKQKTNYISPQNVENKTTTTLGVGNPGLFSLVFRISYILRNINCNVKTTFSSYLYYLGIRRFCLKIPQGKSESVYRRTDNTVAKRKSTNGQTTIYKTYAKTQDRVTRTPLQTRVLWKGKQFLLHQWHPSC